MKKHEIEIFGRWLNLRWCGFDGNAFVASIVYELSKSIRNDEKRSKVCSICYCYALCARPVYIFYFRLKQ